MAATTERLSSTEKHLVCGTGALAYGTLMRFLRGDTVRPVVIYRLKAALEALKLEHRFPELYERPLGGAADPDPRKVLEPEDALQPEKTAAAE
jgi:hypothetical protein